MTIKRRISPALDDRGYGLIILQGIKEVNCQRYNKSWSFYQLLFSSPSEVEGTELNFCVAVGTTYHESNLFGKVLSQMGYKPPKKKATKYGDRFKQISAEEVESTHQHIVSFINSSVGKKFVAFIYLETEGKSAGYWRIQPESIEEY